jgi:hypothetical protein
VEIPEGEERKEGTERLFKEKMSGNSPNLMKNLKKLMSSR